MQQILITSLPPTLYFKKVKMFSCGACLIWEMLSELQTEAENCGSPSALPYTGLQPHRWVSHEQIQGPEGAWRQAKAKLQGFFPVLRTSLSSSRLGVHTCSSTRLLAPAVSCHSPLSLQSPFKGSLTALPRLFSSIYFHSTLPSPSEHNAIVLSVNPISAYIVNSSKSSDQDRLVHHSVFYAHNSAWNVVVSQYIFIEWLNKVEVKSPEF